MLCYKLQRLYLSFNTLNQKKNRLQRVWEDKKPPSERLWTIKTPPSIVFQVTVGFGLCCFAHVCPWNALYLHVFFMESCIVFKAHVFGASRHSVATTLYLLPDMQHECLLSNYRGKTVTAGFSAARVRNKGVLCASERSPQNRLTALWAAGRFWPWWASSPAWHRRLDVIKVYTRSAVSGRTKWPLLLPKASGSFFCVCLSIAQREAREREWGGGGLTRTIHLEVSSTCVLLCFSRCSSRPV